MVHTHVASTMCSFAQEGVHTTGCVFCLCENQCFWDGLDINIAKLFNNSTEIFL